MINAKKPFYKKWWVWILALFIIGALASEGEEEQTIKKEGTNPKSEEVAVEEKATKEASATEPESQKADVPKENVEAVKATSTSNDDPLMSGENGVLADDVFIGLGEDKTNYEEMFSYITANNQDALMGMVLDGRVTFATKGTPITVVDRGFINAKIQIIETGERGWVPVEYLAR